MGLGKTLQAISVAYYYKEEWPLLIVVPSSLRYPWIEELERWFPEIHPHEINLIQGGGDISGIKSSLITVVTYGLLRHPASKVVREALVNQKFKVIIIDESHYMKNRKSATSKYLVPLIQMSERKLLLTGTPALARPEELFPQLSALMPKEFSRFGLFATRYCDAHYRYIGRMKKWMTDGASNLGELQNLLAEKVMIRRLKKDVLSQLPPKQRQRIAFDVKESDLKKNLDSSWSDLHCILDKSKVPVAKALESSSEEMPGSVWFEIRKNMSLLYHKTCDVKLGPVKEYVKMLCENRGLKFIIFAYHHIMMNSLSDQLHDESVKFIRIDGSTLQQDRPRLVHQFQVDKETRVAILSIKAAGVGLTLTAAKLVVFAELDWTPGAMEQCEDRAHRIGQKDTVHVHYLVAKGTLDDWVWAALSRKTSVVTTTLNGKTQKLEMDDGNQGQIDCLANADAYKPPENLHEEITDFFKSQQPKDQTSIYDFFTPKGVKPKKKTKAKLKGVIEPIVIDDDNGNTSLAEFATPKTHRVHKKMDSTFEESQNNNTILTMSKQSEIENIMSSDDVKIVNISSVSVGETKNDTTWNCSACTFINNMALPFCEICNTPKIKSKGKIRQMDIYSPSSSSAFSKINSYTSEGNSKPNKSLRKKGRKLLSPSTPQEQSLSSTSLSKNTNSDDINSSYEGISSKGDRGIVESKYFVKTISSRNLEIPKVATMEPGTSVYNEYSSNSDLFEQILVPHTSDTEEVTESNNLLNISASTNLASCSSQDSTCIEEELPEMCLPKRKRNQIDVCNTTEENSNICTSSLKSGLSRRNDSPLLSVDIDSSYTASPSSINSQSSQEVPKRIRTPTRDGQTDYEDSISTPLNKNSTDLTTSMQKVLHSTPTMQLTGSSNEDILAAETEAAMRLFSPKKKKKADTEDCSPVMWVCSQCDMLNETEVDDCDGCLASRPAGENKTHDTTSIVTERKVNLDEVPVYNLLNFCCSHNTNRIYLYDQDNNPLNVNFVPIDVEVGNYSELPDLLLHPENLKLVKRFVREWNSLSATKRRIVIKSGVLFTSPCLIYEEVRQKPKQMAPQRHITKEDVASAALAKAEEIGGTVRTLIRPKISPKKRKRYDEKPEIEVNTCDVSDVLKCGKSVNKDETTDTTIMDKLKGITQVLDKSGNPLCVLCHKQYENELLTGLTIRENPWQTRFCSRECMHQYWVRSCREYAVDQVFSEEHGVCQLCQFKAHEFFLRIRSTSDLKKRAHLIKDSIYNVLSNDTKEKMVKKPTKGLFWEVDHINPVSLGGGQCDIDNLRTLCTPCHRQVTAQQNSERAKRRKLEKAAACGDITAFFQPK